MEYKGTLVSNGEEIGTIRTIRLHTRNIGNMYVTFNKKFFSDMDKYFSNMNIRLNKETITGVTIRSSIDFKNIYDEQNIPFNYIDIVSK